jgi:hypothetical protein
MEKSEAASPRHSEEHSSVQRLQDETEKIPEATSQQLSLESPDKTASATPEEEEEWEYVTGIKLAVVIIAVTAACFIMLLDTSIVVTVSNIYLDYFVL